MPRERWFFARASERRGPLGMGPLLSALVQERDPRAVLVWRRGFAGWTRAEDVPELEQRLAQLLSRPTGRIRRSSGGADSGQRRVPSGSASGGGGASSVRSVAVAGLAVAAVSIAALLAWRLGEHHAAPARALPVGPPAVETTPFAVRPPAERPSPTPSSVPIARPSSAAPVAPTRAARSPGFPRVGDLEAAVPPAELRKLRGVAAWSGEDLKLTVYNGTAWRVTELSVRIGRFVRDDFVSDPSALRLLPPAKPLDTEVADLLRRVAPDRKKAGLNPLDTGVFEIRAGPAPENFRWKIEAARGYPPAGRD